MLARGAAVRFLLTRLFDWQNRVEGALVVRSRIRSNICTSCVFTGACQVQAPTVWTQGSERDGLAAHALTTRRGPYGRRLLGQSGPGRLGRGAALARPAGRELSGFEPETTNNRMELRGRDRRARSAQAADDRRDLHTDSDYLRQRHHRLASRWKATAGGPPTRSRSRTRICGGELEAALERHRVEWRWVKGHSGDLDNERADQLAREAIRAGRSAGEETPSPARGWRGWPRRCSSRPGPARPRPGAS